MTPSKQLKAGEKVEIEGATFEAPNSDEFTVTAKGHYFTVKDNGQYFSDTFPVSYTHLTLPTIYSV